MTSKHLPKSKTLQVFKAFCNLNLFLRFFIAEFQGLKHFVLQFTQGASIVREDGGFGFVNQGDGDFLGIEDLLETRGAWSQLGSGGGSPVSGVMPYFSALKAPSFSHTFYMFLWGELL